MSTRTSARSSSPTSIRPDRRTAGPRPGGAAEADPQGGLASPREGPRGRKISGVSAMSGMDKGVRGLSYLGAAAGLACLAIAVAGPASADDLNTTTCSEQQMMSSLQQNDPMIWGRVSADPEAGAGAAARACCGPGRSTGPASAASECVGADPRPTTVVGRQR